MRLFWAVKCLAAIVFVTPLAVANPAPVPSNAQPPRSGPAYQPKTGSGQPAQPPRAPRLGPRYRGSDTASAATAPAGAMFEAVAPDAISDTVGLTTSPDPTVFWYLKANDVVSLTVKLNIPGENTTVGRATLPVLTNGYRAIKFSSVGLPPLRPGTTYRWFLEVRFRNGVSGVVGSSIAAKPLAAERELASQCAEDAVCRARQLAALGYWYDALRLLSGDGNPPKEAAAYQLWRQLLKDIGLDALP